MTTYTVHIETTEHYMIEVEAKSKDDAEARAWRLFPHRTADYVENTVTLITCEGEETC